jgi:hypothetical protein
VSSDRLAFDSSPLNYIARANQLPFLEKLVAAGSTEEISNGYTADLR